MGHVAITGGASGIGQALALRLTRAGHRVSVLDLADSDTCPWWDRLPDSQQGDWHVVDVADPVAVTAAVEETRQPLDGLATCAGMVTLSPLLDVTDEEFNHCLSVNLMGTLGPARAVARRLVAQRRPGSIVTLASTAAVGYVANLGLAYHAAKAAVVGLSRCMAGDLAQYGIRVNVVAPGVVRTPMTAHVRGRCGETALGARAPAGRLSEPEEVAAGIAWLLSPHARLITGHVLPIDGGQVAVTGAPPGGFPPPMMGTRSGSQPRSAHQPVAYEECRW